MLFSFSRKLYIFVLLAFLSTPTFTAEDSPELLYDNLGISWEYVSRVGWLYNPKENNYRTGFSTRLRVVDVSLDSMALDFGIEKGDYLTSINEQSVRSMSHIHIGVLLAGMPFLYESDSVVHLTFFRPQLGYYTISIRM